MKRSDYHIYLIIVVVYLLLLFWLGEVGVYGIVVICSATATLILYRISNKELNLKAAIVYLVFFCGGNVLVFKDLFDSIYIALAVSAAIFIPSFQFLNSTKAKK